MKALVCGAGSVGRQIARRLAQERADVTVVDRNPELIRRIADELDVTGVDGLASHPAVLERAGAQDADIIIAATRSDEVNMMACQVAYSIFQIPQKIARIRSLGYLDERWRTKMFQSRHMPVDEVIYPERDVAESISHWIAMPTTTEAVPFLDGQVRLVGLRLGEDCPVLDTPLRQLTELFENLRAIVLAVRRGDDLLVPGGLDVLQSGDEVRFVAPRTEVDRALGLFGFAAERVRRLLVLGGGSVGATCATIAEDKLQVPNIRLIERDTERAEELAGERTRTTVIRGDALDPLVLADGRAHECDAVVAATDDHRVNVLASGLAKEMGCKRVLALMRGDRFRNIADRVGVDATVDPEVATVSAILRHIRRGPLRAIHAVQGGGGDVIEARVLPTSGIVGKRVRESGLPSAARIGAVLAANGMLKQTGGDLVFEENDRVVLFADSRETRRVEGLFQVGLGFF